MPRLTPLAWTAAALSALLLGACGSSGSSSGDPAQSAVATKRSAGLAYSSCMRSHGVANFPDPAQGSGGGLKIQAQRTGSGASLTINGVPVSAPAFRTAQAACAKYLPKPKPLSAQQLANLRQAALKMGTCMRSHGVPNFPDPTVEAGPGGVGIGVRIGPSSGGGGVNPNSPAFQAAQKVCGPLIKRAGGP